MGKVEIGACCRSIALCFILDVDPHLFIGWCLKRICKMAQSLVIGGTRSGKDEVDIDQAEL